MQTQGFRAAIVAYIREQAKPVDKCGLMPCAC